MADNGKPQASAAERRIAPGRAVSQNSNVDPSSLDNLVPRVTCPRCGTPMRFAQLAPDLEGRELMQFDCDCGFTYQVNAGVPTDSL